MTIAEALQKLESADIDIDLIDAVECVLNHHHKYRWHDLKENNRDIPCSSGYRVRVCLEGKGLLNIKELKYCDAFMGYGDMEWYTLDHDYMRRASSICDNRIAECYKVIAWREIEPFEVTE